MRRSREDNLLIQYKISRLLREGYRWEQAAAIAMRMYRDGELRGSTPYSKPKKRKKRETRRRDRYRR
tara:strand:+ start:1704 stop:1904 length:201 start_codon:yes stop_codon:yes gene_type:complete